MSLKTKVKACHEKVVGLLILLSFLTTHVTLGCGSAGSCDHPGFLIFSYHVLPRRPSDRATLRCLLTRDWVRLGRVMSSWRGWEKGTGLLKGKGSETGLHVKTRKVQFGHKTWWRATNNIKPLKMSRDGETDMIGGGKRGREGVSVTQTWDPHSAQLLLVPAFHTSNTLLNNYVYILHIPLFAPFPSMSFSSVQQPSITFRRQSSQFVVNLYSFKDMFNFFAN